MTSNEPTAKKRASSVLKFTPQNAGIGKWLSTRKPRQKRIRKPYGGPKERCRCGCGRVAFWPRGDKPVFHSRKCGYEMALKMLGKGFADWVAGASNDSEQTGETVGAP